MAPEGAFKICLFYRYMPFSNDELSKLETALLRECTPRGILGRFLLSKDGINGSFSSTEDGVDSLIDYLRGHDSRFRKIDYKFSYANSGGSIPFNFLAVKMVNEIIGTGLKAGIDLPPTAFDDNSFGGLSGTGAHLAPRDFHEKVKRIMSGLERGVILDVRNEYEYDIGHFEGARNLRTYYYSETWKALESTLGQQEQHDDDDDDDDIQVLMYCTGGIRCEMASKFAKSKLQRGKVYQLEGGIHRYLEAYSASEDCLFRGKNFVFDATVSTTDSDSNSRSSGGEKAINSGGAGEKKEVVGKCIDCSAPHEVYSGKNCCTVCRYPILVCTQCVDENSHNGEIIYEFYCKRHRYLKNAFYTVLSRFSESELHQQRILLQELLANPPSLSNSRRKTVNKQIRRIDDAINNDSGKHGGDKKNPQLMINRTGGFWQA